MIEIRRDSWLMWFWFNSLLEKSSIKPPRNLCHLAWGLIGRLIWCGFVASVPLFFIFLGGLQVVGPSAPPLLIFVAGVGFVTAVVAGFACLVAVIAGAAWVIHRALHPERPSLFRLWLRAKKERICPLVRVTD